MLLDRGWHKFPMSQDRRRWAEVAHEKALAISRDPEQIKKWVQCEGTWFVGVEALATDATGALGSMNLDTELADFIASYDIAPMPAAQLSIIYPDYPKPRAGDSDAAFRYRRDRDAAHVDGLHAIGTPKRRFLKEAHAFVLGVPLNTADEKASPMVVWEGSHIIMQQAFRTALAGRPVDQWPHIDLTETYIKARKTVFDACERVIVHAHVGEAYAIHPLSVHGVAPWDKDAQAPEEGRMIAYFRPEFKDWSHWLR